MAVRIDAINTTGQHGDSRAPCAQGSVMGNAVDTERQSTDHANGGIGSASRKFRRRALTIQ